MAAERGVVVNSSDRPTGLQGSQSSAGLNPRLGMKCRAYEDWQTGIVHRLSVPSSRILTRCGRENHPLGYMRKSSSEENVICPPAFLIFTAP